MNLRYIYISALFIFFAITILLEVKIVNAAYTKTVICIPQHDNMVYFICGLLVAVLPLLLYKFTDSLPPKTNLKFSQRLNVVIDSIVKLALIGFIWYLITIVRTALSQLPINYQTADMLPVIKVMNERYFSGKAVYDVIPEIWSGMKPVYLPAMWLGYSPAVLLDFDMRWLSFILLILASIVITFKDLIKRNVLAYLPFWVLVLFFIHEFLRYDSRILTMTEEPLVVFYYALFAWVLFKNDYRLIAITLTFCLLSRYALIAWAIVYFIFYFISVNRVIALRILGITTILCIFMMFVFQGFDNLNVFIKLQSYYIEDVTSGYHKFHNMIQESIAITRNFSYENIIKVHYFQIVSSFIAPLIFILLTKLLYKRVNLPLLAICSLKAALVFFFSFILLPYTYLFYTSVFLSLIIFKIVTDKVLFVHK